MKNNSQGNLTKESIKTHCQQFPKKTNMNIKSLFLFLFLFILTGCFQFDSDKELVENVLESNLVFEELKKISPDLKLKFIDVHNFLNPNLRLEYNEFETIVKRDTDILNKINRYDFINSNKRLILITYRELSASEFNIFIYHPNSGMIITNKIRRKGDRYEILDQEIGDL